MSPVGLANTRISTGYAQKFSPIIELDPTRILDFGPQHVDKELYVQF